jgi:uncharacterized RDD family membrane protein YckC
VSGSSEPGSEPPRRADTDGADPHGWPEPNGDGPAGDVPPTRDTGLFYRRIGAWFVDGLLVGVATFLIGSFSASLGSGVETVDSNLLLWALALDIVYRWAMQSAFGFTLGKLLTGVRLVSASGAPPGPLQVLGREAGLFLLVGAPGLLPLGELQFLPLFGQLVSLYVVYRRHDQRAIHDLPVGTRVVRAVPLDEVGRGGGPLRPRMP